MSIFIFSLIQFKITVLDFLPFLILSWMWVPAGPSFRSGFLMYSRRASERPLDNSEIKHIRFSFSLVQWIYLLSFFLVRRWIRFLKATIIRNTLLGDRLMYHEIMHNTSFTVRLLNWTSGFSSLWLNCSGGKSIP
jgi:hypothetical protein